MRSRVLLTVVVLALFVVACNNPTYNRATVERDLRNETGLSASQAACLAKRLEQTIGEQRLGARDAPTAREREKLHAALVFSIVACSGAPYDRAKVERALEQKAGFTHATADCFVREVERRVPPSRLASPDNLTANAVLVIRAAIADATIACSKSPASDLRTNVGITRQQAACVMSFAFPSQRLPNGVPPTLLDALRRCTTTTTTTTTTTVPSTTTSTTAP